MRISDWSSDVCSSDLLIFIKIVADMRDEVDVIPRRGVGIGVEPAERQVRTGKERDGEGARRSSGKRAGAAGDRCRPVGGDEAVEIPAAGLEPVDGDLDRKSTRLNSSH